MKARVVVEDIADIRESLIRVFDAFGGVEEFVKPDSKVFIKYNGVHFGKEMYTDPQVLGEMVSIAKEFTRDQVYVMENSTQSNFTRLVAEVSGIAKVTEQNGGQNLYLDEQKPVMVEMGKERIPTKFPKILYDNLIVKKGNNVLINIPKLKTHLMTTVTLGIKCFQGLLYDSDKLVNHNYKLHQKLVDNVKFIQPDFTIVEGINAIKFGHFPPQTLLPECVVPMNIFIASDDLVACDTVGAKILGYDVDEVEHIKLAAEQGLGVGDLKNIEIIGDISRFKERLPFTPCRDCPSDIRFIRGKELSCVEGCYGNTLLALLYLRYDYNGAGGFNIIAGKGVEDIELENLLPGDILIVGPCTIEENLSRVSKKYPNRKIYTINECNDIAKITKYLSVMMKIDPFSIVPLDLNKAIEILQEATQKGLDANLPL
ncbi:MAG: DUF362 domain-containing protein [Candidatus Jordarchaeum sp.]|uniref:DUF362 domain-containing protein n=1 Tax=Candidatus Jordarchaeum sp. TaxID=2823881 RepID=UPI00404ADE86